VGNFVELKNARVGEGSKINHLSYVGDAEVGRDVNIGAGTITCNYDGANKHRTVIGDGAFIGSDTQLVAPVTVGAIAQRDVVPILLEGLRRLEYRGYDSAGLAVLGDDGGCLQRVRTQGKVAALEEQLQKAPLSGRIGIAHTRWATHGEPADRNAHPHLCQGRVALVHNGIIENHEALREAQRAAGHRFTSDTDTEVVVHQIFDRLRESGDILAAVQRAVQDLEGAYALAVMAVDDPT